MANEKDAKVGEKKAKADVVAVDFLSGIARKDMVSLKATIETVQTKFDSCKSADPLVEKAFNMIDRMKRTCDRFAKTFDKKTAMLAKKEAKLKDLQAKLSALTAEVGEMKK